MCLSVRLSVLLLLRLRLLPLLLQLMLLLLLLWFRVMMISPALTHLKSPAGKKRSQNVQSGPTNQGRLPAEWGRRLALSIKSGPARTQASRNEHARPSLAQKQWRAGGRTARRK